MFCCGHNDSPTPVEEVAPAQEKKSPPAVKQSAPPATPKPSAPKYAPPSGPRTGKSPFVPPEYALKMLQEGNARYVKGEARKAVSNDLRQALATDGQLPMAAILGCADSRCPIELMFDAPPGDIFVCRNAGNAVAQSEGSVIASMEYCVGHLQTKLLVVLGHTKCGAIKGAVASLPKEGTKCAGVLEDYLVALTPAAARAKREMRAGASDDEVAAKAGVVNVLHTMKRIVEISEPLREKVISGELQIHGAMYDITTGNVKFLGELEKPQPARTGKSAFVPAAEALKMLQDGNARYVKGETPKAVEQIHRKSLAVDGQLPMAAILGCADSRCPIELMFDAPPGDIFVCRNAGNAVAHAEGSVVASMEYCVGHLQTKLLVVLGHTKCGAIKGAVASLPKAGTKGASVLEDYLVALTPVAAKAKKELPAGASDDEVSAHAVKVNVFQTMERILEVSEPLRSKVASGELQVQGAIYDITTGKVEFLGEAKKGARAAGQPSERLQGA